MKTDQGWLPSDESVLKDLRMEMLFWFLGVICWTVAVLGFGGRGFTSLITWLAGMALVLYALARHSVAFLVSQEADTRYLRLHRVVKTILVFVSAAWLFVLVALTGSQNFYYVSCIFWALAGFFGFMLLTKDDLRLLMGLSMDK